MHLFFSDLDNTLIYSYKHDIGTSKSCVELYQGREVSFMTHTSRQILAAMQHSSNLLFIPVTTRTCEQYERIQFPKVPSYAITCNGGILLKDGVSVPEWYETSLQMIKPCTEELKKAAEFLEQESTRTMEVRFIEQLFLFTKSSEPEDTRRRLCAILDASLMDVFTNGVKVYAIPKQLNKGTAVSRFLSYYEHLKCSGSDKPLTKKITATYGAGDSLFDIPMLRAVSNAYAPASMLSLANVSELNPETHFPQIESQVFSDWLLQDIFDKTTC